MRIHKLRLDNFRGFDSFQVELHPKATVIIGENAAGKTAILEGLVIAAGAIFLGLPVGERAPSIAKDQIRRVLVETAGALPTLELKFPVRVEASGRVKGQELSWSRALNQQPGRTTRVESQRLRQVAAEMFGQAGDLPVLAYYGTSRLWLEKSRSKHKRAGLGTRLNGYIDCLSPASNHKLLTEWMRRLETVRLEAWADAAMFGDVPPEVSVLEAVRTAVVSAVPKASNFLYSMRYEELRIKFEAGETLPFGLLSDGYRNFVGMIADIAWRCAQLNPHLGSRAAELTSGVVMVDEIDLHLHPGWQRTALKSLIETFPNIQFIVTTHSPQVIASAKREWMRFVSPGESSASLTSFVQTRSTNAILEDIMGVLSDPGRDAIRRVAESIDNGQYDEAARGLDEMALLRGQDDEEVVALRWELKIERGLNEAN